MNTQHQELPPSCEPVTAMYGDQADELMHHPKYADFAPVVAQDAITPNTWSETDRETGMAAKRTLQLLGCEACELSKCTVRPIIEEEVALGEKERELLDNVSMALSAPTWLKVGRIHNSSLTRKEWEALAKDKASLRQSLKSGQLNSKELLGDVQNELIGIGTKQTIPELAAMDSVKDNVPLEIHQITSPAGVLEVIDATSAIDAGVDPANAEDYEILVSKLISIMVGKNELGQPQVLRADGTIQKPVPRRMRGPVPGPGKVSEIRMGGKSRLYIKQNNNRVIILGTHHDSESDQIKFVDYL